jgi:hypothetical protein
MLCKFWTPLICLMVLRGFDLAQDMQESERVKFLELLMLAESCYICIRGWEIEEEVTTLRCECPSWAHEACLAKSVFETGGCPTCRKSILLIDDEIVLGQAAQMEMQRSSDGYW